MGEIIGFILGVLSFIMFAFMFHWINVIKVNSDEQLKQNEEMVQLLKQINDKLEK